MSNLANYVVASSKLWHLVTFLCHQYRCRDRPTDGIFHQQQALLRTLPSPTALLSDHVKLWWSWRRRSTRTFVQLFPQMILAGLVTVGTLAASIFSSYVVTSNNIEVLVQSPFCGTVTTPGSESWSNYLRSTESVSRTLATECYLKNSTGTECRSFISPRIAFTQHPVPCPFKRSICKENVAAIQVSSDLQEVSGLFGLNTGPKDKVFYKKSTTCSVLSLAGRTSLVRESELPSKFQKSNVTLLDQEVLLTFLGPLGGGALNSTFFQRLWGANISWSYGKPSSVIFFWQGHVHEANKISSQMRLGSSSLANLTTYVPIPELQRLDADVVVKVAVLNAVQYAKPVNDPLFSAHRNLTQGSLKSSAKFYYISDFPQGVLGCALQVCLYVSCMISL